MVEFVESGVELKKVDEQGGFSSFLLTGEKLNSVKAGKSTSSNAKAT